MGCTYHDAMGFTLVRLAYPVFAIAWALFEFVTRLVVPHRPSAVLGFTFFKLVVFGFSFWSNNNKTALITTVDSEKYTVGVWRTLGRTERPNVLINCKVFT